MSGNEKLALPLRSRGEFVDYADVQVVDANDEYVCHIHAGIALNRSEAFAVADGIVNAANEATSKDARIAELEAALREITTIVYRYRDPAKAVNAAMQIARYVLAEGSEVRDG